MSELKTEQLRASPSRTLKNVTLKAYEQVHDPENGVDFLGYANTLYFALNLFMYNFGPAGQNTECPEAAEFTRIWMTDSKAEAEDHFITQSLLEPDTQINIMIKL